MENLLREYMDRAFAERGTIPQSGPGPVVTLSREFGCPSKLIAQQLTEKLNHHAGDGQPGIWRFISKEVVEATARRLELNPNEVNYLMSSGNKGIIGDVLASFSPTYVSNLRMRNTIRAVVNSLAGQGHVVIVGRGGVGVLQHHPNTLHVRLLAPREWRITQVCKSRNLNTSEASRLVDEMDKKRASLIELMTGEKFNPCLFDITINCSSLSLDEITGTIMGLMETKKMTG
ncbi:MAG: cytidylate kinase-like family protein [Bacteroidota bacterium]